jgi:hypothetical protein
VQAATLAVLAFSMVSAIALAHESLAEAAN